MEAAWPEPDCRGSQRGPASRDVTRQVKSDLRPTAAYHRDMRLRGRQRREFQIELVRAPWIEHPTNRVAGVHRHVRVTLVGREVGAWNGYTERVTASDVRRLTDWLEEAAGGASTSIELGTADERLCLAQTGEGSLVIELRGELRPWYSEETPEVMQFGLQVEPAHLRDAARDLRAELQAWLE